MIKPQSLDKLLENDRLGAVQAAIVARLTDLLPGIRVIAHPGKVDLSEIVARSVVSAPGIGLGWSRIRREAMIDGSWSASVDWTA